MEDSGNVESESPHFISVSPDSRANFRQRLASNWSTESSFSFLVDVVTVFVAVNVVAAVVIVEVAVVVGGVIFRL